MSGSRWTVGLLGLWIAVAAFIGLGSQANLWNNLVVGLTVALAAFLPPVESPKSHPGPA